MTDESIKTSLPSVDTALSQLAERKVDNQRILASLAFAFIIVVVGCPMWWKTTEVYRVPLPYANILALNDDPLRIYSTVAIFTHSDDHSERLVNELRTLSEDNDALSLSFEVVRIGRERIENATTPARLEEIILSEYPVTKGNFLLFEWAKFTEDILVTSERSALISARTTAKQIHLVLQLWIYRNPKLRAIFQSTAASRNRTQTATVARRNAHISAPPSAQYDVLVSVFNPRPDQHNVHWNVRSAMESYIESFANEIRQVSDFVLKSQWKYQVPFEFVRKRAATNTSESYYGIAEEHLPHIITSIESKLGVTINENPTIHLIVYAAPCERSPLYFDRPNGVKSESFLSPKWGGIIVANPAAEECAEWTENQQRSDVYINSHDVMHRAIYILRRIIDIHVDIPLVKSNITQWETIAPRTWEVDSHFRLSAVHLAYSATATLQSLVQLLDGIRNIVINDDVGLAISKAYDSIVETKVHLKRNNLDEAMVHARNAFESAERAFFDPSLLALLYFPDDQKYAIYFPLFLPVMLPIVLSLWNIVKHFAKKRSANKEKLQ